MAKKLYVGTYRFDASEKIVFIKGNINVERFLIITNVTDNVIIYNFANPSLGFSLISYNVATDETQLSLLYDTTSMSDTDKLQVFIDNDYQEITPAEDMLDPVGKMRVSNPENLIDTDFEYGLQGTKWETLQTVNNLPTIFTNTGDVSLDGIQSLDVIKGSKSVKVTTSIAHGLVIGNPISVLGTLQYQSEGSFVVTSVTSDFVFFYETDVAASETANISASYTTIVPGKFYEGSSLVIDSSEGVVTDGASPSALTATTDSTHGFSQGTKLYLRNSVGPKVLGITTSNIDAPDGKPFVDTNPQISVNLNIDQTANTGRSSFRQRAVVTYDWEGTYQRYIETSDVSASNDTITWNQHGLHSKALLLFQTPYEGRSDMGLSDGRVYYTEVVDSDTIKLHTTAALGSAQNLTTPSNTSGFNRLVLVYKVEAADGTLRRTSYGSYIYNATNVNTVRVGTNQISVQTFDINLTALYGSNAAIPTTLTCTSILLAGDVNSTNEWVEFTVGGQTQRLYSPGNQSDNLSATSTTSNGTPVFNGLNLNSSKFTSGSTVYLRVLASCSTAVGTFTSPQGYRYSFSLNLPAGSGAAGGGGTDLSGYDLTQSDYGLGNTQPNAVIAFQGVTPNSANNSADSFSYLANQRVYGRYGTYAVRNASNTLTISGGNLRSGNFVINYNDSSTGYGTNSEIFYIMANVLSSDRNTIYQSNHGLTGSSAIDCTVSVGSTAWANGERFKFAALSGASTEMPQNFNGRISVLTPTTFRLQTTLSPSTDDITQVPSQFVLGVLSANPTYNTVFIQSHKINGIVDATYNNVSGTGIGANPALSDGDGIKLERYDDNRLIVKKDDVTPTPTNIQTVTERNTNASQTIFLDLETPAGFAPGTANITSVEFRGDFSASSEYLDMTFDDSDTYRIGEFDDNGDTATYTTSTTLLTKDVSTLLKTVGGKVGIEIVFDASPAVNYGPGGGPWWGIRISYTVVQGGIVLTSPGTGEKKFTIEELVGAYDGIFTMNSIPSTNTFAFNSTFQIPARTYTFGSSTINGASDVITMTSNNKNHNLVTGEKVSYDPGSNTSILPAGVGVGVTDVFVIGVGDTTVKLAASALDALNNNTIDITSQSGIHTITASNVVKNIKATGTVTIVNTQKTVVGSGTKFLTDFKRFDSIFINNGTYIQRFIVDTITTDTNMTLFEAVSASGSGLSFYYETQLALRPDGFSLHKSFDGGVDITAGTSPDSRICRQTRKYFRYQSGKGIQTSFAINFNPPKIVSSLLISTGNTATVRTQEQHNLAVNDIITIEGATVNSGVNYYNGTFTVASTPDEFTFTYVMTGIPLEVTAGGFPTYVRQAWSDSAVRAGMFDDQNGFFYEYDGQYLYAVRRSSTTQVAGQVSVNRNSAIVNGTLTAFTSQLNTSDKVVIRGQTYKVVEISSDTRLVVQPPYRGITATGVKMTKTIDTKTRQSDWNLDPADGTGFTGYILNINKIQMAYIDYSWYGAGKIRYGFKDRVGHIRYFHEYRHNNVLDESYFRSGNLPARYEIENGPLATTAPTLFHFGTSVMMDGRFDDDKAYQFTGESRPQIYTNGGNAAFQNNAATSFAQITLNGRRVYVYAIQVTLTNAQQTKVGVSIKETSGSALPAGTYVTQVKLDGATSVIYTNYPATTTDPTSGSQYGQISNGTSFTIGETTAVELARPIPLISVRLAPSVDSSLTGPVGAREIINRMQLQLKQASVTTNTSIELFLVQNALPSDIPFEDAQKPSLSEIIKHKPGDTIQGGTTIFSTKSSSGSVAIDLSDLLEMGNSILGGDGIFPSGPDLLTVAVQPQDTSSFTLSSPFSVSGKISWSESQA